MPHSFLKELLGKEMYVKITYTTNVNNCDRETARTVRQLEWKTNFLIMKQFSKRKEEEKPSGGCEIKCSKLI